MPTYILTSIDTMVAVVGLGLLMPGRLHRRNVFCMFFCADAAATFCGWLLRGSGPGQLLREASPVLLAVYLLAVAAWTGRQLLQKRSFELNLLWVAIFLGFDNLVTAASDQTGASMLLGSVIVAAASSGVSGLIGLEVSKVPAFKSGRSWQTLAGGLLLTVPALL